VIGAAVAALVLAGFLPARCSSRHGKKKIGIGKSDPPQRPPGKPKPMLEEDIGPTLARLDAWYAAHLPSDRYRFNPPASDVAIDAFERLVGIALPASYRQL
jgi:hypothetical protein